MLLTDNEIFEIKAEAFRIMTGHMAPGKYLGAAAGFSATYDERVAAWESWLAKHGAALDAFVDAVKCAVFRQETCPECDGDDDDCMRCGGNGFVEE